VCNLSPTLKEENRQRVFEDGVLGHVVGPKREGVARGCRRLHNKQLYVLYSAPNIIHVIKSRRNRRGMWHVQGTGEVHRAFWW